MIESTSQLFEILNRNPEELIGELETDWLDFKSAPYELDTSMSGSLPAAFELAKDVSAMANAGGGVIVIGVKTELLTDTKNERAIELVPVQPGRIDRQQIVQIVGEWVHPRLDVLVQAHPMPGGAGALWSIYVPPQHQHDLPFVLTKEISPGRKGPSRNIFGVYQRREAENASFPPAQVQAWVNAAWRERADAEQPLAAQSWTAEHGDNALNDIVDAAGVPDNSLHYFVQAGPQHRIHLRQYFPGAPDSLAYVMQHQPALRPMGFNLPDGMAPQHTGGDELLVVLLGDAISVSRSGLTSALQTQDHLTHGMESVASKGEVWINPLALVEFTLEFWRFFLGQVVSRMDAPSPSIWRAGMRGLGDPAPVHLPVRADHFSERRRCPNDSFTLPWAAVSEQHPERMAYLTLVEVYAAFGMPEEDIPYTTERAVNAELILRQGRQ